MLAKIFKPVLLAIDDNPDNLSTLHAVLSEQLPGATFLSALNGPDGIALARVADPDVILLDIVMPGMDGYDVCRALKADAQLCSIPVLFLTAMHSNHDSRSKALEAGGEGFLSKPLDELELLAQITVMAKIKAASQLQQQKQARLEALVTERTRELQQELTERIRIETALRASEMSYRSLVENAADAIFLTDAHNRFQRVNRRACEMLGYAEDEFATLQVESILITSEIGLHTELQRRLSAGERVTAERRYQRKDGSSFEAELSACQTADGQFLSIVRDISERKKAAAKIQELAFFDQLTGLPNRTLLHDRLKQAMTVSSRISSYAALLLLDLDNFKTLNDTRGHEQGDLLLQQVALRLKGCIRDGDTVARLGGDEFMLILNGLGRNNRAAALSAGAVAEKILSTLGLPHQLGDLGYQCTVSIGLVVFIDERVALDELMKQADLAMYTAKEAGRNGFRFFDPEMQTSVLRRVAMEVDLQEAIKHQQFTLYYQAQISAQGQLTGAEVLIRWQHPQRGLIAPDAFIPLAEETGLILPLGQWVLATACTQLALWANCSNMAHLSIAVNVSAHQLAQPEFVEQVLTTLANSNANPRCLKLELTESALLANVEDVIKKMQTLKNAGVRLALDDFGTGYSSLSYLKRLPLDQLKIDQSFVQNILSDANDASIAKTIIALGQNLGMDVIAEGVETAAQRDFLAQAGCLAYQGYFFSRPVPLESFEQLIAQFTPASPLEVTLHSTKQTD
jgi:diguanylate cyclase (GGDEF)-like protein/PAS domain S-box-containing protein